MLALVQWWTDFVFTKSDVSHEDCRVNMFTSIVYEHFACYWHDWTSVFMSRVHVTEVLHNNWGERLNSWASWWAQNPEKLWKVCAEPFLNPEPETVESLKESKLSVSALTETGNPDLNRLSEVIWLNFGIFSELSVSVVSCRDLTIDARIFVTSNLCNWWCCWVGCINTTIDAVTGPAHEDHMTSGCIACDFLPCWREPPIWIERQDLSWYGCPAIQHPANLIHPHWTARVLTGLSVVGLPSEISFLGFLLS